MIVTIKNVIIPEDPNFYVDDGSDSAPASLAQTAAVEESFNPNSIPPINLRIESMKFDADDWGNWQVKIRPQALGLDLNELSANVKKLKLSGNGRWRVDPAKTAGVLNGADDSSSDPLAAAFDQNTVTSFNGMLTLNNIADVLAELNYDPTLKTEKGSSSLDFSWSGAPFRVALESLRGTMKVRLENGSITSVDSAASSVKVIGLLNFEKLLDRLQFNFKDVYEKGLAFNVMQGNIDFDRGILSNKIIKVEGPSAQFELSGVIDLLQNTVDQEVTVVLPITRNLVLPAGVVGGLPGAATVYLVEKAFGEQLDKLTTIYLTMTGNIENPSISEVKFFR